MRREALPALLSLVRPVNVVVIVVAGASLGVFVHGAPYSGGSRADLLPFLLLPTLFSLGLVWLVSEAVRVCRPSMSRAQGLLIGLGLHFSVGVIGWMLFPDVPCNNPRDDAVFWIPLWIVGLVSKVGDLGIC